MRGLFDSIFKNYNEKQALYQQAARNVLMNKDKAKDDIAVAQIAKLQSLTPAGGATLPVVSSAPKSSPVATMPVVSATNYTPYIILGGAALAVLALAALRK